MSDVQEMADKYPSIDTVHLAIMEIARLSHTGKHGQRIKHLLGLLVSAESSSNRIEP